MPGDPDKRRMFIEFISIYIALVVFAVLFFLGCSWWMLG